MNRWTRRASANFVVDVEGVGFPEDDWAGCHLAIGSAVELCVGQHHGVTFGLQATVVRTGTVCRDDTVTLIAPAGTTRPVAPPCSGGHRRHVDVSAGGDTSI